MPNDEKICANCGQRIAERAGRWWHIDTWELWCHLKQAEPVLVCGHIMHKDGAIFVCELLKGHTTLHEQKHSGGKAAWTTDYESFFR